MVGGKMKKNARKKEFFMEIRKSMGRFLSIFLIVALGVSIFVGIHATEPDMILSGDAYVDESKLMDIKVVSTYGLTEEDVEVIEALPSIEKALGSYSTDVLCGVGDSLKVLHVMAHTEDMNLITVTEGRLPKAEGECLLDEDFLKASGYEIGDVITMESGTDAVLTDMLKNTDYQIVGSGNSPLYFSLDRGNSTIGNGSVSGFAIVSPKEFVLDVYTEVYAVAEGAAETTSFTEEYEELIDEALKEIQLVQNGRCEVRRNDLAKEAQLQVDAARNELNTKKEDAEKEISENEKKLEEAELEIKLRKLQVENGKTQVESAKTELETNRAELRETREAYDTVIGKLNAERKGLETKLSEAEQKSENLGEEAQKVIQETMQSLRASIEEISRKIDSVTGEFGDKIAAGEKQIAEAQVLLAEKEAELLAAEKELAAAEKEIASGKSELSEAKTEMDSEIQDGETQIESAEAEISALELPTWYVFDRTSIPEYSGYESNADRIAALAIVFPGIFFLVAALISLTTMTRMVEEQRVQIGTLKALGYSKGIIMKKYVGYALLATLGGSVFGVLVGEKLFPYIIIMAYKILYQHIPHVLLPYQWGYALLATAIAVCCTVGATLFSCYKVLGDQPAVLMRPEAPKIGKRTLIERIPFLWRHLNFTWKSTLRNLFRYKKRFLMTLLGIGGCMGLLMVGFGLRDSISSIVDYQYGELQLYDSSVYLGDNMEDSVREELATYLADNPDISASMSVHMSNITIRQEKNKEDVYLVVIDDVKQAEGFFVYRNRVSKEKYELSDDGMILTEKAAKTLGVKAGDTVWISSDGRKEQQVTVTAVCENYMSHYAYMTLELYESLYEDTPVSNCLFLQKKEGVSEKEMEQVGENILAYEGVLNVQYTLNLSEKLHDMLFTMDQVIVVLVIVAGMLSFVVLYNLNNINITERRRELATLKVLGFYDIEVAAYVYRENILLTLLGTLLGCGIGKFLHAFTIETVEVDVAMFGRQISVQSYLIGAAFTIGFSMLVNLLMYFKLKKIDMVESLKSVE